MTTASPPRTVWTVLFGSTIMSWPRIAAQQVVVLGLLSFAANAHSSLWRWFDITWAVVVQVWLMYDATVRARATWRARHQHPTTSPAPD